MAEQLRAHRKSRTRFTEHQLQELRAAFKDTQQPKWDEVQELASRLQLDQVVVKVWFKNQKAKLKKQQQAKKPPVCPSASCRQAAHGVQVPGAAFLSPQQPFRGEAHQWPEEPQEFAAPTSPGLSFPLAAQPLETLEVSWTTPLPYSTEELARVYGLSGDEDPSSLDKCLLEEPTLPDLHSPEPQGYICMPQP
ncbi:paired-like homeodomain transcription factor LEUTX [Dipodomys spectabilis]|uniref:paired-like homeodomain transcription factor LEUTX n=1 Tax=Dipodomys spectabilis TaxID=105255 RepID=UPI001C545028|nr:paired-like homeodomain transcription factor LEUTX [Dipodomys spectabilis]